MKRLGRIMVLLGCLAAAGELLGLALPTVRWFFAASRETPWLHCDGPGGDPGFPWFGWLCVALLLGSGLAMIARSRGARHHNPVLEMRWQRFKSLRRGHVSLVILCLLAVLAGLDQTVVGKRALAVQYQGKWVFPAFMPGAFKNADFGGSGDNAGSEADYRALKHRLESTGAGRVIMPPVPFDPTGDTQPPRVIDLTDRDGVWHATGAVHPFSGMVERRYPDGSRMLSHTMRGGYFHGQADGWSPTGIRLYHGTYEWGNAVAETYSGEGTRDDFLKQAGTPLHALQHHPAPPKPSAGCWLGTTSQGYDVLAYLYGGLQVNFKAALIYLPAIYLLGITIGLLMGYFGGWFDLLGQRVIEVFSNMPFLFIVIIIASMVPDHFKGLPVILTLMVAFGWMDMTFLMRTSAYRDRERDYIAAARVLGAGTPRVVFRHLLPNTVAILVTLVPFSMSGLIFSLTSLDYLGFGLPSIHASWGRLLQDGIDNLSAPWLATSACAALVATLVLITFVGEAVRDAFDPRKFTYYQ